MIDAVLGILALSAVWAVVAWRAYAKGKQTERKRAEKVAQETKERIDEAIESSHSGGAAWRDRLRDHNDDMRH